jgi:hypothetical protein
MNTALAYAINFAISLAHKSNWNIRHKVEYINSSPGALTIEVGRVRP